MERSMRDSVSLSILRAVPASLPATAARRRRIWLRSLVVLDLLRARLLRLCACRLTADLCVAMDDQIPPTGPSDAGSPALRAVTGPRRIAWAAGTVNGASAARAA